MTLNRVVIGVYRTVAFRRIRIPYVQCPRRNIATEISPTTTLLRADERDNEVFLIGTAHISQKSADEIEELIQVVQPDKVFVELDPHRAAQILRDGPDLFQNRLLMAFESVSKNLPIPIPGARQSGSSGFFQSFFDQLKQHGLIPGTDMKSAILAAQRANAEIVYGDRPIEETIQKIKQSLHPSMFLKAMTTPLPPELQQAVSGTDTGSLSGLGPLAEQLKSREHARAILTWMDKAVPEISRAMVHERDAIMAKNLRRSCGSGKVVAVVGMVHLEGVQREWLRLQSTGLLK